MAFPNLEKTVFVVTYGRSGSTLIQNLINQLPGHILRGENNNLLLPLAKLWHTQSQFYPEQVRRMEGVEPLPSRPYQPWYGYEQVDVDGMGRAMAQMVLRDVLKPAPDTRTIGFKEIRWHEDPDHFEPMLEFLRRYMPGARFIFNTRDHGQVSRSGWWSMLPEAEVRADLEKAEALFDGWRARHPDLCLTMHYNDYVARPESFRALFAFLDMPYDADLVARVLGLKLVHLKDNPNAPWAATATQQNTSEG